jgi:hypothetical protein
MTSNRIGHAEPLVLFKENLELLEDLISSEQSSEVNRD